MSKQNIESKIKKVIAKIEPNILSHGGGIEFVGWDAKSGIVRVRLGGVCQECPMSWMTLKYGLEQVLKKEISQVKEVQSIG